MDTTTPTGAPWAGRGVRRPATAGSSARGGAMIIWGWRRLTSTVFRGTFYCPECSPQRAYSRRRMRPFCTLYYIPLFPTTTLGKYIECDACKSAYKDKILDYQQAATPDRATDVA